VAGSWWWWTSQGESTRRWLLQRDEQGADRAFHPQQDHRFPDAKQRHQEIARAGEGNCTNPRSPNKPASLAMECRSAAMPSPTKFHLGSEDAFYIIAEPQSRTYAAGVFDGIGSWRLRHKIDAALYARDLAALTAQKLLPPQSLSSMEALEYGVAHNSYKGSSTACILALDPDARRITGINVGDSVALILREEQGMAKVGTVFRTTEQRHKFNQPYQLGTGGDPVSSGTLFEIDVQESDIVVLGTDGLFDNLFDEEVMSIIDHNLSDSQMGGLVDLTSTANELLRAAFERSQSYSDRTPFEEECRKEGESYFGGKPDDISVIVCNVCVRPHDHSSEFVVTPQKENVEHNARR